jgi:predicted DNA binding protein
MNFWSIFKTVAFAALIFSAGAIVGGVATVRFIERRVSERIDDRNWSSLTMNWLDRELTLTAEQRSKVEPIVKEATQELKEIRDETEIKRRLILNTRLKEVRSHLTENQNERLRLAVERVRRQIRYVGAPFR